MKSLKFFNTLTSKLEDFNPIDDQNIRIYVCGPTVYDHIHIGNARPIIVFDVLVRLLQKNFLRLLMLEISQILMIKLICKLLKIMNQ